jgi:hypothetical protein
MACAQIPWPSRHQGKNKNKKANREVGFLLCVFLAWTFYLDADNGKLGAGVVSQGSLVGSTGFEPVTPAV